MGKNHNQFLEYILLNMEDDICKRIKNFCRSNIENIIYNDPRYSYLSKVQYFGVNDFGIQTAKVWEHKEISPDTICFEIIANPEVIFLYDYDGHYSMESDSYNKLWLRVQYFATMDNENIKDVSFNGTGEYDPSRSKHSLDGALVPYISREDYDKVANEFLSKYYPEAFRGSTVNPLTIVERMGLKFLTRRIKKDKSVFGQSYFMEVNALFYDEEIDSYKEEEIEANTIVIDDTANYYLSLNSINITIIHECLHFYLHKKAFSFARIYNKNLAYLECLTSGGLDFIANDDNLKYIEIQANAIAPCVLMNKENLTNSYETEVMDAQRIYGTKFENYAPHVIENLADKYGVTKYAVKKRLIDLGYSTVKGVFDYVDGHYLTPYLFDKDSLREGETYSIGFDDLVNSNKAFIHFAAGKYRFIENHVVLNNPKYITKEGTLSDYARVHLDECAVKFKVTAKSKVDLTHSPSFVVFCYLCRDIREDLTYEIQSCREPDKFKNTELKKAGFESQERITNMRVELIKRRSFSEMFKYLMEQFKTNKTKLADESGISRATLNRYVDPDKTDFELRPIMALCIFLNLPPVLSEIILKATVGDIPNTDEGDILRNVLTYMYDKSIDEVNDYLKLRGVEPLLKEEKKKKE